MKTINVFYQRGSTLLLNKLRVIYPMTTWVQFLNEIIDGDHILNKRNKKLSLMFLR